MLEMIIILLAVGYVLHVVRSSAPLDTDRQTYSKLYNIDQELSSAISRYWVDDVDGICIDGVTVSLSTVYIGKALQSYGSPGCHEPSLIDLTLAVDWEKEDVEMPGYLFGFYRFFTPAQRAHYLRWIASEQSYLVEECYAYTFLYGLERRLLFDVKTNPVDGVTHQRILAAIIKVKTLYIASPPVVEVCDTILALNSYSSETSCEVRIYHPSIFKYQFMTAIEKTQSLNCSIALYWLQYSFPELVSLRTLESECVKKLFNYICREGGCFVLSPSVLGPAYYSYNALNPGIPSVHHYFSNTIDPEWESEVLTELCDVYRKTISLTKELPETVSSFLDVIQLFNSTSRIPEQMQGEVINILFGQFVSLIGSFESKLNGVGEQSVSASLLLNLEVNETCEIKKFEEVYHYINSMGYGVFPFPEFGNMKISGKTELHYFKLCGDEVIDYDLLCLILFYAAVIRSDSIYTKSRSALFLGHLRKDFETRNIVSISVYEAAYYWMNKDPDYGSLFYSLVPYVSKKSMQRLFVTASTRYPQDECSKSTREVLAGINDLICNR